MTTTNAMSSIASLRQFIEDANHKYHNGLECTTTDREYDAAKAKLRSLSPNDPLLTKVGSPVHQDGALKQRKHTFMMGSLNNIKTEEELRAALKEEIQQYWDGQSRNQVQDQLYHYLLDETKMEFPAEFLTRWLQTGGEQAKTPAEAEAEFPVFRNQLKWTLISDKLIKENSLDVSNEDLRNYMKTEVMRYFGTASLGEDTSWIESYIDRMMKDEKQVDSSYRRLITEKLFSWVEGQVKAKEKEVTADELNAMQHHHQH